MVETLHSHCRVASSIPGQGTKILHAVRHDPPTPPPKCSSDYTNVLFLAQDKSLGYRLKKGEAQFPKLGEAPQTGVSSSPLNLAQAGLPLNGWV